MILHKLSLTNFRNHAQREFLFSAKINLIIGANASGKTNILEAIYLLATGKSFRVKGVEEEMIKEREEMMRVKGVLTLELEIVLTRGEVAGIKTAKKKYSVNGVGRRAADFTGNLKVVFFGPEDLGIITGSPSARRRFLDGVLSQVDREYFRSLLSYEKGLRTRNKLLEQTRDAGFSDRKRFFFWDQLLIKNGNYLTSKREDFIDFVNRYTEYRVDYDRSTISPERLAQYANEELAAGTTLVGPHRDDIKVKTGERNLAVYGSRGEQRLAVLWMKLMELKFIKTKTEEEPVLLLDDIFSELDPPHRELVLTIVSGQQTIITATEKPAFDQPFDLILTL